MLSLFCKVEKCCCSLRLGPGVVLWAVADIIMQVLIFIVLLQFVYPVIYANYVFCFVAIFFDLILLVGTSKRVPMLLLLWQCVWTWLLIYYVLFIFGLFYIMATNSPCEKSCVDREPDCYPFLPDCDDWTAFALLLTLTYLAVVATGVYFWIIVNSRRSEIVEERMDHVPPRTASPPPRPQTPPKQAQVVPTQWAVVN